jgi:hypothetical protein
VNSIAKMSKAGESMDGSMKATEGGRRLARKTVLVVDRSRSSEVPSTEPTSQGQRPTMKVEGAPATSTAKNSIRTIDRPRTVSRFQKPTSTGSLAGPPVTNTYLELANTPVMTPQEIMMRQYYFDDYHSLSSEEQRRLHRTAALFADNYNETEVVEFLTMERKLREFQRNVKQQTEAIEVAAGATEREVTNMVTSSRTQVRDAEDAYSENYVMLGPPLEQLDVEDRVSECRGILLRGAPELVDETKYVSHISVFASPLLTVETAIQNLQKINVDMYSSCQELALVIPAEKANVARGQVGSIRRIIASNFVFLDSIHAKVGQLRGEMEELETLVEANAQAKMAAVRVGREFQKENDTLRAQLYQTSVRGSEERSVAALSGEINKTAAIRFIVLLQCENTHTLRLSQPTLISEALAVAQTLIEAVAAEQGGKRTNFNSLAESTEPFHRVTNKKFPPESYFFEFSTAVAAVEFGYKMQTGLLKLAWPTKLLEIPEFAEVPDPDQVPHFVWRGLRFRCVVHAGTPTTHFPLADPKTNGGAVNTPYNGGAAVEKASALLSRTRGGEIVATAKVKDAFSVARFENPQVAQGIQLVEKPNNAIMQTVLAPGEKVYWIHSILLEGRRRTEERYAFHAVYHCVFPNAAFWRNVEGSEDLQVEFEDDSLQHQTQNRMNALQYEELVQKLKEEAKQLNQKITKLQDVNGTLIVEVDSVRADLQSERILGARRQSAIDRLTRHRKGLREMMKRQNIEMMNCAETRRHLEVANQSLYDQLSQLRARESLRLAELASHTFEDAKVGPDDAIDMQGIWDLDATTSSWKGAGSSRSPKHGASGSQMDESECISCENYRKDLYQFHELAQQANTLIGQMITGAIDETLLLQRFQGGYQEVLGEESEIGFKALLNCAVDQPTSGTLKASFCGHLGKVMQHIKHYEILREISKRRGERRSSVSDGKTVEEFGNELEYLFAENGKLQAELAAMANKNLEEKKYLIGKIDRLESSHQERDAAVSHLEEELVLRTQTLTMKLQETSNRATKFYNETCRLVKELHGLKDVSAECQKIKKEFIELANLVDLNSDEKQVFAILRVEAADLQRSKKELEERLQRQKNLFEAQDRIIVDMRAMHQEALRELEARLKEEAEAEKAAAVEEAKAEQQTQFEGVLRRMSLEELKRDAAKLANFREREEALRLRQEQELRELYASNPSALQPEPGALGRTSSGNGSGVFGAVPRPGSGAYFAGAGSMLHSPLSISSPTRGGIGEGSSTSVASPARVQGSIVRAPTRVAQTSTEGSPLSRFSAPTLTMAVSGTDSKAAGVDSAASIGASLRLKASSDASGLVSDPPNSGVFEGDDGFTTQPAIEVICPHCNCGFHAVVPEELLREPPSLHTAESLRMKRDADRAIDDIQRSAAALQRRISGTSQSGSLSESLGVGASGAGMSIAERLAERRKGRGSISSSSGGVAGKPPSSGGGVATRTITLKGENGKPGRKIEVFVETFNVDDDVEPTFQYSTNGTLVSSLSRGMQTWIVEHDDTCIGTELAVGIDNDSEFAELAAQWMQDHEALLKSEGILVPGFGGAKFGAGNRRGSAAPGGRSHLAGKGAGFSNHLAGDKAGHGAEGLSGGFVLGPNGQRSATEVREGQPKKAFLVKGQNKPHRVHSIAQLMDMKRPKTASPQEAAKAVGMLTGGGVKRPPTAQSVNVQTLGGGSRGRTDTGEWPGLSESLGGVRSPPDDAVGSQVIPFGQVMQYQGKDIQYPDAHPEESALEHTIKGRRTGSPERAKSPFEVALEAEDQSGSAVHQSRVTSAHNKSVRPGVPYLTMRAPPLHLGVKGKDAPRTSSPIRSPYTDEPSRVTTPPRAQTPPRRGGDGVNTNAKK